ncbi:hypothetical protein [Streptomyces sp. SID3343]|uniref:hypothetical protein n=1 Tax=Streptomyces sp. SID3343 TaxID=2690260 RepID=UPI00136CCDEB|nr:hypothetical protein [Streptomyces sp. SID3343]MYV98590.1 hypothetical protein [Streptomyces sp. SID3343]
MTEPVREVPVPREPLDTEPLGIECQTNAENRALLYRALADAGVRLGTYDRRIVDWFGASDSSTVLTVASLITRAGAPTEDAT